MAHRVVIEVTSDLSGSPATETVSFALGGMTYEIDLTGDEAIAFRAKFRDYIDHGRRLAAATRRPYRVIREKPTGPTRKAINAAIRDWAARNSIPCPVRGRIPGRVREQWEATHPNGYAEGGAARAGSGQAGSAGHLRAVPQLTFNQPA